MKVFLPQETILPSFGPMPFLSKPRFLRFSPTERQTKNPWEPGLCGNQCGASARAPVFFFLFAAAEVDTDFHSTGTANFTMILALSSSIELLFCFRLCCSFLKHMPLLGRRSKMNAQSRHRTCTNRSNSKLFLPARFSQL